MARRNLVYGFIAIMIVFFVAGCSTAPKKLKEEVTGIKSRVDTLESRVEGVETKQADVERVTSQQMQAIEDMKARKEAVRTNITTRSHSGKSKAGIKEIQNCLANAGFYTGKIDGVKGKNTKKAIKDFQKANGLKADGKVGPKTWEALSKYSAGLAASAAPSANIVEEGSTK